MAPLDLTKNPPRSPREQLDGLVMLPRMIDIARAKLPGGAIGEYQIGRGMSGAVLRHFRLTADELVGIVAQAEDDNEVLQEAARCSRPNRSFQALEFSEGTYGGRRAR